MKYCYRQCKGWKQLFHIVICIVLNKKAKLKRWAITHFTMEAIPGVQTLSVTHATKYSFTFTSSHFHQHLGQNSALQHLAIIKDNMHTIDLLTTIPYMVHFISTLLKSKICWFCLSKSHIHVTHVNTSNTRSNSPSLTANQTSSDIMTIVWQQVDTWYLLMSLRGSSLQV